MSTKTLTTNGAVTHKSTGDALINLFFTIGAARNNAESAKKLFDDALASDIKKATAILLYCRDVRSGMGERNIFRILVKELIASNLDLARKVLRLTPQLGRWDDVKEFYDTPLEAEALQMIVDGLANKNALCAKWQDRSDRKLSRKLHMNECALRKYLAKLRKDTIVEHKMCENRWSDIAYDKLPSLAGIRYSKTYKKKDEERYTAFINDKDKKVNSSIAFPHNIYQLYKNGEEEAASKYWANMSKLNVVSNILCVVDVSGSMCAKASGTVSCMDVSVSLGTFLAQQIKGHFHNKLITFSATPTIVSIPESDNIGEVFDFVARMDWGGNTNLEATFNAILSEAKKFKVSQDNMPATLLILSDMEFDSACSHAGATLYETMRAKFASSGYKAPSVCFWNLNGSGKNFPVMKNEKGACLVSGFSPKVIEAVVGAKQFTPESVVEEAIKPYLEMIEGT